MPVLRLKISQAILMRRQAIMGDYWDDCQPGAACHPYRRHVFNQVLGRRRASYFRDFSGFIP